MFTNEDIIASKIIDEAIAKENLNVSLVILDDDDEYDSGREFKTAEEVEEGHGRRDAFREEDAWVRSDGTPTSILAVFRTATQRV